MLLLLHYIQGLCLCVTKSSSLTFLVYLISVYRKPHLSRSKYMKPRTYSTKAHNLHVTFDGVTFDGHVVWLYRRGWQSVTLKMLSDYISQHSLPLAILARKEGRLQLNSSLRPPHLSYHIWILNISKELQPSG